MGLSASMWTSVSGLLAHGNKMNVVGNNIANVSTIGFKGQRMDFNDYLYINGGSTSGPTQIGAGVSTYAVLGDFSQGSLESTNSVTDLAIDGEGWFKVRKPNTEQMYYTRAGDFYFNADRQLQNPEGYRLQGWKVDAQNQKLVFKRDSINLGENKANESAFQGTGTPKDIVLDSWYIEPLRTSSVSFTMGLTSDKLNDRAIGDPSTAGPFLGLVNQWDATRLPDNPMPDKTYATQSAVKIYDESGIAHELTVYYDQVSATDTCSIEGLPAGYSMYEYIVTIPPTEDMRMDADGNMFNTTRAGGLLMTGHMVFDAAGNMVTQTAYTYQGDGLPADDDGLDLQNWKATKLSANGLPVFVANFKGLENCSTVDKADSELKDQLIEIDFGLRMTQDFSPKDGSLWDLTPAANGTDDDGNQLYKVSYDALALADNKTTFVTDTPTKAGGTSFVTQDAQANGYTSGVLSGTNITNDGVVYGYYDNGETIPLYQIALYDFHNEQGLRREGGNLYAATKESGDPRQGVAGDNGFGVTRAYNIEGSNVDMSREFVNMITTQRGFQANSKGITTVDTMLETVIGMKR